MMKPTVRFILPAALMLGGATIVVMRLGKLKDEGESEREKHPLASLSVDERNENTAIASQDSSGGEPISRLGDLLRSIEDVAEAEPEREALFRLFSQLSAEELQKASGQLAAHYPDWEYDGDLRGALFQRWVEVDPVAALAAAGQLGEDSRGTALFLLAGESTLPPDTLYAFLRNPENAGLREVWQILWERYLDHGSVPADKTASLEGEARAAYIDALSRKAPHTALAWFAEEYGEDPPEAELTALLEGWTASDPVAAAQWALSQEGRGLPEDKVIQPFAKWAVQEPEAFAEFLTEAANAPGRDRLIDVLVRSTADYDPIEALSWAERIEDSAQRESARHHIFRRMARFEPELLENWLDAIPVSPEFDAELRQMMRGE